MSWRAPAPAERPPRGVLALAVVLLAAMVLAGYWFRRGGRPPAMTATPIVPTVTAPHAEARSGGAYVGDAACARCHAEIADAFRQHPMGRSMSAASEALPRDAGTMLTVDGLEYAIDRRDGRVFHRETRRDPEGRAVESKEAEVRYALGSGTRGHSFLIERGDSLYQSPLSWYTQAGRWDLAPGYREKNLHFDRKIVLDCLFCHTNRVELTEGRPPVFHGLAIGCERCHGPGEHHAARPASATGGKDSTIVNPADLEPFALRDAVCEQCHLQGIGREARPGRSPFDYRPGLPLDEFLTISTRPSDRRSGRKAVGHVEQMRASLCYRSSDGQLGCISCHDPHRLPAADRRVAYYRGRCLECHADRGCNLPDATRLAKSPADDCVSCHMPKLPTRDIPHTAGTLHSIPRHAGVAAAAGIRQEGGPGG